MNSIEIESKIRNFLADEMMKERSRVCALTDQLDLDSLEKTELRVFLEEDMGVEFPSDPARKPNLETLEGIISFASAANTQA